jgi:hypothetical protein
MDNLGLGFPISFNLGCTLLDLLVFVHDEQQHKELISKVDFTKDGTSNVTVQTTSKKLSLWIFFLLVELETKLTSFYHHTLHYHNT